MVGQLVEKMAVAKAVKRAVWKADHLVEQTVEM